jgi:cell division protein FtsI/penicillin-binding protein 2
MAAAGFLLVFVALWVRAGWLQIPMHATFETRAQSNWGRIEVVPPERGRILDRQGRPLARDLLTCSIAVHTRYLDGAAATARALARALGLDAQELLRRFQQRPGYQFIQRGVPPAMGDAVNDLKLKGVYVKLEQRRDDLLGAAAAEVIGRTNLDNVGVEGLELQYEDELRGLAGWTTRIRDARGRAVGLNRGLKRSAENGHTIVTTLDADLQAILESHLSRAVDTLRAVRAFGLFLDPRTGEVLACVNVPHLPPGRARNWNFTDQFEPGSTFKIVVAGASLEEGTAEPDQWFEAAASGQALIAPGAVFHDTHKQAAFTFRDAVRWSSNIVMGKLGLILGAQRLYRYAVELGFGGITGVEFPGEAGGKLRSPEHWSARSTPTIAIGHELSVTPLQLGLAYAAIANGGVLMRPMLVREIRDERGNVLRQVLPSAAHRVFSPATTATLGGMLEAVVDSGTARAARVPGLSIAGKTGTAQKYDASTGTYGVGKFVSSFAGYTPAPDPRLVGVIVIDEPRGKQHFGGEVAAPVFREVMLDLQRLPRGPLDPDLQQVVVRPPAPAPVVVPDLRLLPPTVAEQRLDPLGLRAHLEGSGPRVLSQDPAAGASIERGGSVTVWLSAPEDSASRRMPDLVGTTLREAMRRLWRIDVAVGFHGEGVVVRQAPAAGAPLPSNRRCELWCQPGRVQASFPVGGPARWALAESAVSRAGAR